MNFRDEVEVGGKALIFESGKLAGLADGAVTVRYGDTLLLATAVASKAPREGIDFFPLTVDFEEKLYAAGKIPGGFIKREGRPSEHAILSSRLTDRPLRPLFPKGFRNDVQVVINVLSADQENDPDVIGICGASAALMISDIPFNGPVAAVRVGYVNDTFVINPTESELKYSDLDLVVAGTRDAVMMVEAGAQELPESVMLEAVRRGHDAMQAIIDLQERIAAAIGKPKRAFKVYVVDQNLKDEVAAESREALRGALYTAREAGARGRRGSGQTGAGRAIRRSHRGRAGFGERGRGGFPERDQAVDAQPYPRRGHPPRPARPRHHSTDQL